MVSIGLVVKVFRSMFSIALMKLRCSILVGDLRPDTQNMPSQFGLRCGTHGLVIPTQSTVIRSDQWLDQLQSWGTLPRMSTEAWQKGRVERHGQIIKRMIERFDNEKTIANTQEFDTILQACFQAKNALMRHEGFSPE